jgi:hypothetical protein
VSPSDATIRLASEVDIDASEAIWGDGREICLVRRL